MGECHLHTVEVTSSNLVSPTNLQRLLLSSSNQLVPSRRKTFLAEKNFNPKDIKALALDLDGTLLRPDKTLSERNLCALRSCMEKDISVILATGRAVDSGEKYRKQIGAAGPHVYYNGAEVLDISTGKVLYTRYVDPAPILFCVQLARQMGLFFQAYFPAGTTAGFPDGGEGSGEILMADRRTTEAERYEQSTGIEVVAGDMEEHLAGAKAIIKGMFITTEENHEKIRRLLREQFGQSIYIVQSTPVFLEILADGVSKGAGLEHALNYLNINKESTIAFGDEENDMPMFGVAGFSAAPANAKKAVYDAALFRIPADADDGVAVFLEEHFVK